MGRESTNCMTAAEGYRRLAALVEALEAAGVVVTGTRVGDDTDGRLPVELRVELPIEDAAEVAPWEEHSAGAPTEAAADDPLDGRESTEGTGATGDGEASRTDDAGGPADGSSTTASAAGTEAGTTDEGTLAATADRGTGPSEVGTGSGDRPPAEPGGSPVDGSGAVTDRPTAPSAGRGPGDGSEATARTDDGTGEATTEDGAGGDRGDDGDPGDEPVEDPDDAAGPGSDASDDRTASDDPDVEAETDADTGGDGSVTACSYEGCNAVFATERGMKIHRTRVHGGDDDRPAHRDTDALREVYARHDTFAEMTEALGVDVTPQAVRQQMIRRGIHDPDSTTDARSTTDETPTTDDDHEDADTDGEREVDDEQRSDPDPDAPASTAQALDAAFEDLDGEGFGTDLGVDVDVDPRKLAVAVEGSSTLYEVQRELGLGSEETQDVLSAFDLLDLVMGRVATREDREERKAEIPERIRRSLADGAPS